MLILLRVNNTDVFLQGCRSIINILYKLLIDVRAFVKYNVFFEEIWVIIKSIAYMLGLKPGMAVVLQPPP
jgi:hypothetical protein